MGNDDSAFTGFDDEPTVIEVNEEDLSSPAIDPDDTTKVSEAVLLAKASAPEPPALPFPLASKKMDADQQWFKQLPPAARAVLERARTVAPGWPIAQRVPGAVAMPAPPRAPARRASA